MKNKKCVVFDFSKGKRVGTANCHYLNGQLDLDLKVEVMSPEPAYGSNVIEFRKPGKKKKDGTSNKGEVPYYTA